MPSVDDFRRDVIKTIDAYQAYIKEHRIHNTSEEKQTAEDLKTIAMRGEDLNIIYGNIVLLLKTLPIASPQAQEAGKPEDPAAHLSAWLNKIHVDYHQLFLDGDFKVVEAKGMETKDAAHLIEKVKSTKDHIVATLREQTEAIAAIVSLLEIREKTMSFLVGEQKSAEFTIQGLETLKAGHLAEIARLQGENAKLVSEKISLQQGLDAEKAKVIALAAEKTRLASDLAARDGALAVAQQELEKERAERKLLATSLATANSEIAARDVEIKRLHGLLAEKDAHITNLMETVSTKEAEFTASQLEVEKLRTQVDTLQVTIASQANELEELKHGVVDIVKSRGAAAQQQEEVSVLAVSASGEDVIVAEQNKPGVIAGQIGLLAKERKERVTRASAEETQVETHEAEGRKVVGYERVTRR